MGAVTKFKRDLELIAADYFCFDAWNHLKSEMSLLLPPEVISTTECAEQFRYIRSKEGTGKILWSKELMPYIPGIHDALDSPKYRFVIVVGPGRSGKSVAGENHLYKRVKYGPLTDVIVYLQALDDVRAYANKEFRDLWELNPEISTKIHGYPKESVDNSKTYKRVDGRSIQLFPANEGNVRQKEAAYIMATEIDGYRESVRDGFKDNIGTRMQASGNRAKAYIESHPDRGWTGGIAPLWKDSTRGLWYWPCPECDGWSCPHPLAEKGMEMRLHIDRRDNMSDDDLLDHVAEHASMECPHCGSLLDEEGRLAMLAKGRWVFAGEKITRDGTVTGKPRESESCGFWIHGMMSPFIELSELARKWMNARLFYERTLKWKRLKEVECKTFGIVYEGAGSSGKPVEPEELMARERRFSIGTIPRVQLIDGNGPRVEANMLRPRFITAAVDIGGAKFDVGKIGWDLEGRSWIIDRFTITQNKDGREVRPPERIEDWMLLEEMVLNPIVPFFDDDSMGLPIAAMSVDLQGTEGTTPKAREFARIMGLRGQSWGPFQKVRLVRGGSSAKAPEVPKSGRVIFKKPKIMEFTLNVDKIRALTVERLHVEDAGPGQVYFADGLARAAFDELAGERQLEDGKWERHGANEMLDIFGYCEAARVMLGPERSTIKWDADKKSPAKLPIWARPVAIGESLKMEVKPMEPRQRGLDRLAALNKKRPR